MKRLICFLIGHGDDTVHEDGKGAAWSTCNRCGKVISAHSWHGGEPWLEQDDFVDLDGPDGPHGRPTV